MSETYRVKLSDGREFNVTTEGGPPSESDVLASLKTAPPANASWWNSHPTLKAVATGVVNTLPAAGAMAGGAVGAASGVPTVGATSIPMGVAGAALGAGVGRGARDLIAEASGLEPASGVATKAGDIALDTAVTAATPGVIEAVKTPFKTAGEFLDWAKGVIPKALQPKFVTGAAQFLKDLGTEAPGPILTRPVSADVGEAIKPSQVPQEPTNVAPKVKLSAFDVIRYKGLIQRGMTPDQAMKSVLLSKSASFANLPADTVLNR